MVIDQCVWAQLYIEGTKNPSGGPFQIKNLSDDDKYINDLMEKVHAKKSRSLEYCNASDLTAYTTVPCSEESKLHSFAFIPKSTINVAVMANYCPINY